MIPRGVRLGIPICLFLAFLSQALAASAPAPSAAPVIQARPLKGLRADVAALILNGRQGGVLWAAMLAAPVPGADGKTKVGLWIELDGVRLKPAAGGEEAPKQLKVEVHAYAMRMSGGLAGSLSQSFRIPLDQLGPAVARSGIKFSAQLELEAGDYEMRVLVRETATQRYVLRVLPLSVPRLSVPAQSVPIPENQGLWVGPPFFSDVDDAWIRVREGAIPPPVFDLSSEPSVLPVLRAGQPLTARIPMHGIVDGKRRLSARLLDGERQGLGKIDIAWADEEDHLVESSTGFDFSEVRFELPDDLLTGNYFLETTVARRGRGGAQVKGKISTTQIYVLGLERTEVDVVWTDLRHLDSLSERRREALDLAAARQASKRVNAIAMAYRGVLEILAGGSIDEAVNELERLETEVLEADLVHGRAWLGSAQDQVLGSLARADSESLVPVLLLHMIGHEEYVGEKRRGLTFHARERVILVARRYVESAKSELAPTLAAEALADMGSALERGYMWVAARRMMEESLALDERNTDSILGLALDHEQRGEFRQAVLYLKRLLTLDPNSEEGRFRLALNLQRSGDEDAAEFWPIQIPNGCWPWPTNYKEKCWWRSSSLAGRPRVLR